MGDVVFNIIITIVNHVVVISISSNNTITSSTIMCLCCEMLIPYSLSYVNTKLFKQKECVYNISYYLPQLDYVYPRLQPPQTWFHSLAQRAYKLWILNLPFLQQYVPTTCYTPVLFCLSRYHLFKVIDVYIESSISETNLPDFRMLKFIPFKTIAVLN